MTTREEHLARLEQARALMVGDLNAPAEREQTQESIEQELLADAPEGEATFQARKPNWIEIRRGEDAFGNRDPLPTIRSPRLEQLAANRFLGSSSVEESLARIDPMRNYYQGPAPEGWEPTYEDVLSVADKYQLPERYFESLARSSSYEEMEAVGEMWARRQQREIAIGENNQGVSGFLAETAVAMMDPSFILLGGVAGKIARVGYSTTRTGNALRAGLSAGVADGALEAGRVQIDPAATYEQAAVAAMGSFLLGGALGSLNRGVSSSELKQIDNTIADVIEAHTEGTNRGIYQSSAGAAQANPVLREPQGFDAAPESSPQADWRNFGSDIDFLERSDNPETRDLATRLVWNPATKPTQQTTAFNAQRRIFESGFSFVRTAEAAARDYFRAQSTLSEGTGLGSQIANGVRRLTRTDTSLSPTGGLSTKQRKEFNERVGRVLAGVEKTDDPNIMRAVEAYREGFGDSLAYAQDPAFVSGRKPNLDPNNYRGSEAFKDIETDPNYLPRTPNRTGFDRLMQTHGWDTMVERLAEVFYRSNIDRVDQLGGDRANPISGWEYSRRFANAYLRVYESILNPAEAGQNPFRNIQMADRNAAKEIVAESFTRDGVLDPEIEAMMDDLLDLIAPVKKETAESPRPRPRATLNLDAELDGDLLDMWNWNAEELFIKYRRDISGHAGLLRAGFRSVAEAQQAIDSIARSSRQRPKHKGRTKSEVKRLQTMLDLITGKPLQGQLDAPNWYWMVNQIRRFNIGNLLPNVGFLAMSELGGVMVHLGPMRLLKYNAEWNRYLKLARAGDPEAKKSIFYFADVVMGHGSSQIQARTRGGANRFENEVDQLDDGMNIWQERIDTFSRKQANLTMRLSGQAGFSEWARTMYSTVTAMDFHAAAKEGVAPFTNWRRMNALGISEEMWERIATQLRKMPETESPHTGEMRPDFRLDLWDDEEALNAFIEAIDRDARRIILEGDVGHSNLNLSTRPSLQILTQLLSFPINAAKKHTGFALTVRDWKALQETVSMGLGGALGFASRTLLTAQLKADEEERRQYLEERFTPMELSKGAFYYSAHASIMPNMIDFGLHTLGGMGASLEIGGEELFEPQFSFTRTSGLPGDLATGNPTYSRATGIYRALGEFGKGTKFSEQDVENFVQQTMPLGRWMVTNAIMERLLEPLPDEPDED